MTPEEIAILKKKAAKLKYLEEQLERLRKATVLRDQHNVVLVFSVNENTLNIWNGHHGVEYKTKNKELMTLFSTITDVIITKELENLNEEIKSL